MLHGGGRRLRCAGLRRSSGVLVLVALVLMLLGVPVLRPVTTGGWLPGASMAWASGGDPCPPTGCVHVDPDPKDAAFLGTGGLLIPGDSFTGSDTDRHDIAACANCRWALVPVCKQGQPGVGCGPAATSCPAGSRRMVVLLMRPPDTTWSTVGSYCVSGSPVTVDDVAHQLSDVVLQRVPPLTPSFQPAGGTLVNLPAIFSSGQPARLDTRRFDLVGFGIVLDARASWHWDFGDGAAADTDDPGGAWPDRGVSHTYTQPGRLTVRVVSQWQGWFTVDGMGPFAVAGAPVTQTSGALPLVVHEARAVLVGE